MHVVDIIFSISGTREVRGYGVRSRVCDHGVIPCNWKDFLHSDENKKALFHYLAQSVTSLQITNKDVSIVSTLDDGIVSSTSLDSERLTNCNHKEADRLFLHVRHAVSQGLKKVMIWTVDTDVVVLAIANVHNLQTDELWISFGVGKNQRFLDINEMAMKLTVVFLWKRKEGRFSSVEQPPRGNICLCQTIPSPE